jgi:transposase
MNRKYEVKLREDERQQLHKLTSAGTAPARKLTRAHILLKSDSNEGAPNWSYQDMCKAFDVSEVTIARVRRDFAQGGVEGALERHESSRVYTRRLDGEAEARLITLACSESPDGRSRWTLRLLQEKLVELEIVESVSHETVRATLKKTNSSLG